MDLGQIHKLVITVMPKQMLLLSWVLGEYFKSMSWMDSFVLLFSVEKKTTTTAYVFISTRNGIQKYEITSENASIMHSFLI